MTGFPIFSMLFLKWSLVGFPNSSYISNMFPVFLSYKPPFILDFLILPRFSDVFPIFFHDFPVKSRRCSPKKKTPWATSTSPPRCRGRRRRRGPAHAGRRARGGDPAADARGRRGGWRPWFFPSNWWFMRSDGTFMGFDGILIGLISIVNGDLWDLMAFWLDYIGLISIVNGDLWDLMAFWLDYTGFISIVNGDLWDLMELLWDLMAFCLDFVLYL